MNDRHSCEVVYLDQVPDRWKHAVIVIGNFDGCHRGHQSLLKRSNDVARSEKLSVGVLTFEPHPKETLNPDRPLLRIATFAIKRRLLGLFGADFVVICPFDKQRQTQSSSDFSAVLAEKLTPGHVIVGEGFRFGFRKEGDVSSLREHLKESNTMVHSETLLRDSERSVSSTDIREDLRCGNVHIARRNLGYTWFCEGAVVRGERRGRALGFPTANISVKSPLPVSQGVYAVYCAFRGKILPGAASFGRRPQFDNGPPVLEVHVLGSVGDLYGESMAVLFVRFMRSEARFEGVEALKAQMACDVEAARSILSSPASLAELDCLIHRCAPHSDIGTESPGDEYRDQEFDLIEPAQ